MKFIVIGIADTPRPYFPPEILEIIRQGSVFSGGRRHRELTAGLLPREHRWIDITVPVEKVFEQYDQYGQIIVFASGDPLFYGFANTILRLRPEAGLEVYPGFNSLQMLAHRCLLPYHDLRAVSLTGRPWQEFDRALIENAPQIGVLTDHEHTPAAIAARMLDYGYTDYRLYIGQRLGHPHEEKTFVLSPRQAAGQEFDFPNCLIVCGSHPRRYGLPDEEFELLDGRSRMITKMPVRLLSLQALDLPGKACLWDIGFCTGSISIEARLQFPRLRVEAFEIRPQGQRLMDINARRFGAPGIGVHIGDFLQADLSALQRPEAVFIGGHGGRLGDIMARACEYLPQGGCIVMNSVNAQSRELFSQAAQELGLRQEPALHIELNDYHPIDILKCVK